MTCRGCQVFGLKVQTSAIRTQPARQRRRPWPGLRFASRELLLRPATRGGDDVTRPSALARFMALAVGLIIAGCQSGGAGSGSPSSAAASQVTVQAPTSLAKAGTVTDCVDIEYPPMEYF